MKDANDLIRKWQFEAGRLWPVFRYAFTSLPRYPDPLVEGLGTDGLALYYGTEGISEGSDRDFFHTLIHCIFCHMVCPKKAVRELWDLACDISAEFLRTELFPSFDTKAVRLAIRDAVPSDADVRVPASVYRALTDLFEDDLALLARQFQRDDHRYWYETPPADPAQKEGTAAGGTSRDDGTGAAAKRDGTPPGDGTGTGGRRGKEGVSGEDARALLLRKKWEPVSRAIRPARRNVSTYGLFPGSREEKMLLREKGTYDFSRYLRRFSVTKEELIPDLGSFDYIPYTYGFARYGNMPFIEPLEYAENRKVEEMVIAIDTSGSCSIEMVERFLREIRSILMDTEHVFRKMNIHIIQCDAIIQDHTVIRSREDWEKYRSRLTVKGRGGTSFVPVFQLVEKLMADGALRHLRGLLYFTDGDGVYPDKETPYETAFVLGGPLKDGVRIPSWIRPLYLDPEDYYEDRKRTAL